MDNASSERDNLPAVGRLRVLKLGGSLLDLANLRSRFNRWLADVPPKLNLMVVGGGELVEELRRLDTIHGFDAEWIHERCIDLMHHTAMLAQQIMQLEPLIEQAVELERIVDNPAVSSGVYIVSPAAYRDTLPRTLPKSWAVTSDSLAACLAHRLAQRCGGCELVILKSTGRGRELPSTPNFKGWSECGLVDPFFGTAAAGLACVQMVNLRGEDLEVQEN